jgi:hypothetical protein
MATMQGRNGGTLHRPEKGDKALPGAGRPLGSLNHSTKFKKFLEGLDEWEIEADGKKQKVKLTREEILMYRLYKIAMKGDQTKFGETSGVSIAAIKEIHERTHGKAPQPTEHTGKDGSPIEVKVSTDTLTIEEKRLLVKLARKSKQSDE